MWEASDEALLAGLAAGDETASAAFVRRFQGRVFGLALAVVHDQGRAAEVAQDAFVRAWKHAEAFDPRRGSVLTWLLAITRNLAIDHRRAEARRPAEPVDWLALTPRSPAPGPDDTAVQNTDVQRVLDALAELPTAHRRSVVLATIGGRTAREISETEGIPLGTAKTRVRDGLIKLRAHLRDDQEVTHD